MKWVIIAEIVITLLLFSGGVYSNYTARSPDEAVISAPLYLGAMAMFLVIFATLFGWWMWNMTFRG